MPASRPTRVKALPIVTGAAGLCLAGWLLHAYGIGHVLSLLGGAGWLGLLAVVAFHLVQVAASAAGWQAISASAGRRPGLSAYVAIRLVREGVNNMLPVAQIGGPVVGARLLQGGGMALTQAIATTIADLTLELVTQVLFTLLGLGVLLLTVGGGNGVTASVVTGLLVAATVACGFVGAQWFGLGRVLELCLLRLGGVLGWKAADRVQGLHTALRACYARPVAVLHGAGWHMVSWLLGGVEISLALHMLGHDVRIGQGLVIESLGQALKSAGFAVPGALGVQEGGYIVVCGLFQLSPDIAIALSLVKRLREVSLGLPALAAWYLMERRNPALRAAVTEDAMS
jgi:putative membrane protein